MSGYLAILGGPPELHDPGVVARMAGPLRARSPEGLATRAEGSATLLQGLLRVYPDEGREPAVRSLDGRSWLLGDFRLDDRERLRAELGRALGISVAAATDAELILHAYRAWADRCVEHLLGDFSFVIWDQAARSAFVAVDHLGVRPLYHAAVEGGLVVSNTLQAIRRLPGLPEDLDDVSVADFLMGGVLMDAERTMLSAIRRLPAAHRGRWAGGASLRTSRYWTPSRPDELRLRRSEEYVERFSEVFGAAVRDRLRGSPVSIELSGGLDSTVMAAFAVRELGATSVRGWCASHEKSFPDPEPAYAAAAADFLGVPLRVLDASACALFDESQPPGPLPARPLNTIRHTLAREMAAHSRLALSGFDGDSVLRVDYPLYLQQSLRGGSLRGAVGAAVGLAQVSLQNRRFPRLGLRSAIIGRPAGSAFSEEPPDWLDPDLVLRAGLRGRAGYGRRAASDADDPRSATRAGLTTPIWLDLFESYDPGATGVAISAAHPFMDLRLIAFLHSIPPLPWSAEKHILRRAGRRQLPAAVLRRPKTPLAGDTLASRAAAVDALRERFLTGDWPLEGYVRRDRLLKLDVAAGSQVLWVVARMHGLLLWLRSGAEFYRAVALQGTLNSIGEGDGEESIQGS